MSRARRIPENSAAYARWLAAHMETRHRGLTLSPATAMFVGMALQGYAERLDEREAAKLKFKIVAYDQLDTAEVLAATASVTVAWAAFQAAIPTRPNASKIVLLEWSRIMGVWPVPGDAQPGPLRLEDRPERLTLPALDKA
jgi:hypothetical protein